MENAVIQTAIDILANNKIVSVNTSLSFDDNPSPDNSRTPTLLGRSGVIPIFDVAIEMIQEFHRKNNTTNTSNTPDTSSVIKDSMIRGPITMNIISDYIDPADNTLKTKTVSETTITPQYKDNDNRPFTFDITDKIDGVIDYSDAINRANMKITAIADIVEDAKQDVASVIPGHKMS